jgi:hypothetical protein
MPDARRPGRLFASTGKPDGRQRVEYTLKDRRVSVMARPKFEKKSDPAAPAERRILPMQLQIGDWLVDETGEYEVIGQPYTTAGDKTAGGRVQRFGQPGVTELRPWGAHERISMKRTASTARRARPYLIGLTNSKDAASFPHSDDSVPELRFGLRKLLGTRGRDSRVRRLAASWSGPATCLDKLALSPRIDLLELRELRGRAWLLHECRNTGGGERDDHGRGGSLCGHALGRAAESPAQP